MTEMPKFFNLESNAYNDFIKLYNGGIDLELSPHAGLSKNANKILDGIQCTERNNKTSGLAVVVLFIFLSIFFALTIFIFEQYILGFVASRR